MCVNKIFNMSKYLYSSQPFLVFEIEPLKLTKHFIKSIKIEY